VLYEIVNVVLVYFNQNAGEAGVYFASRPCKVTKNASVNCVRSVVSQSFRLLPTHSRCRGCFYFHLITLRHTPQSVGLLWRRDRPVAELSTWQHKHSNRQTSMPSVGFEPTIPARARLQTYALDRAATGIGVYGVHFPFLHYSKTTCIILRYLFCPLRQGIDY
jgi:hypothetical protein